MLMAQKQKVLDPFPTLAGKLGRYQTRSQDLSKRGVVYYNI